MTQTPLMSEEPIRSLASVQSFDCGFRYYRGHSVFDIARRGNLITARVEGSDCEPYRVQWFWMIRTPDWGIHKCKQEAEQVMDVGQSGAYNPAVYWLGIARDIYMQHKRQQEWETYLSSLLETHSRKYKLIPMLQNIGI